jgi:hypothetical protein
MAFAADKAGRRRRAPTRRPGAWSPKNRTAPGSLLTLGRVMEQIEKVSIVLVMVALVGLASTVAYLLAR